MPENNFQIVTEEQLRSRRSEAYQYIDLKDCFKQIQTGLNNQKGEIRTANVEATLIPNKQYGRE